MDGETGERRRRMSSLGEVEMWTVDGDRRREEVPQEMAESFARRRTCGEPALHPLRSAHLL
jgi:hypothetical protein